MGDVQPRASLSVSDLTDKCCCGRMSAAAGCLQLVRADIVRGRLGCGLVTLSGQFPRPLHLRPRPERSRVMAESRGLGSGNWHGDY